MTGRELIRLQATLQGLPSAEGRRRADDLLERVGLVDAADRRVGTYSGGMQRRLDLAAALVHEPRVLFLDEPTTGLDPVSRKTIWEEVREAERRGDDGLPHHPVPGGGRPARRQRRDHRQRPDRRRGHAGGAQGRDRQPPHRAAARRGLDRRGGARSARGRQAAAAERRQDGAGRGRARRRRHPARRAGARRGRDRGRVAGAGPAHPRRRLRRQDRLPPRGGGEEAASEEAVEA